MSATQELIAASLTLADMDERVAEMPTQAAADVREACARAMVQPDVSEVERLLEEYTNAFASFLLSGTSGDLEARNALLDAVRAIVAERDALKHDRRGAVQEGDDGKRVLREVFALCEDTESKCSEETNDFNRGRLFEAKGIARAIGTWYQDEFCGRTHMGEPTPAPDQFRDAAKMVPDANDPDPLHLSRILHELAGAASMCWIPRPSTAVFDSQQAIVFVEQAIAEIRQRMQMMSAAPQPVGEICTDYHCPGDCGLEGAGYQHARQPVGEVDAVDGIPVPTGHAEADRLIGRLMSSDPDYDDCADAAALIQREIKGPDGFATWRDAALAERIKRTQQPIAAAEVPMPEENILKIRALDSAEVRWIDREALRTYGEQCRAAGYAAGVAAALRGEVK